MHQRQAHHAVVGVDAEIADQAMGVKITVLGTDAGILQFTHQLTGTLLEWLEGDGRCTIVIAGMRLADQAHVGTLGEEIQNRRTQLILVLQD